MATKSQKPKKRAAAKPATAKKAAPKAKAKSKSAASGRLAAVIRPPKKKKPAAPPPPPKAPVAAKRGATPLDDKTRRLREQRAKELLQRLGDDAVHIDEEIWAKLDMRQQAMVLACMFYPRMIARACAMAFVPRSTHYRWEQDNPHYAQAIETARLSGVEMLASRLRDRAIDGVRTPILYQGKRVPILDELVPPVLHPKTGKPFQVEYDGQMVIFRGWEEKVDYDNSLAQWLMGALDKKWAPRSRHDIADETDRDAVLSDADVADQAFKSSTPDYDGEDLLDPTTVLELLQSPEKDA